MRRARGGIRGGHHPVAFVVWLESFQPLGHFSEIEDVLAVLAGHVPGVLSLADGVKLWPAAPMSAGRLFTLRA
jgi:hypothetical protein